MHLRLIRQVVRTELSLILFYSLNTTLFVLIFGLRYSFVGCLYPITLSLVILCFYLSFKYIKLYQLSNEKNNLKIPHYIPEYNTNPIDHMYLEIIDEIHHDYNLKIEDMFSRNHRNEQLLSQFFHNMKTSVAVIELALGRDNVSVKDIKAENDKLKLQLEQSLNVLRLDRFVKDYMPERISLIELITTTINENKSSFIYHKLFPKVYGDDYLVFTDRKWFKYLLEQLISNAVKYSIANNEIEFIINNNTLIIRDYGIGIPEHELERIFDLFYTGSNGRDNKAATGIGLSMVKTVAKMLDIEIEVSSVVNKGTDFKLTFLTKM